MQLLHSVVLSIVRTESIKGRAGVLFALYTELRIQ